LTEDSTRDALDSAYRTESRRVLATLVRLLGDLDDAEEALHDAFVAAAEQWPRDGVPANPYAWLVSAGRFKAINRWRRRSRLDRAIPDLAADTASSTEQPMIEVVRDDELRLIFICCHPALPPDARVALTLREVAGLATEEIARAYVVSAPTIAQRIVRAKSKIRDETLRYELPSREELPSRLESVLHVLYLVFNEGYGATTASTLTRADLCAEAIRLTRQLAELLDEPEVLGLLALMLLHDARSETRVDAAGDLVLLEEQDRSRWRRAQIAEADRLIARAMDSARVGTYVLQAAIASVHANAPSFAQTDWRRIVSLYDALQIADPSPFVALNRAVALGMRDGPAAGLAAVNEVIETGRLDEYHLAHAARADLQRRLGQRSEARASYARALELSRQPAERRFLSSRLAELESAERD